MALRPGYLIGLACRVPSSCFYTRNRLPTIPTSPNANSVIKVTDLIVLRTLLVAQYTGRQKVLHLRRHIALVEGLHSLLEGLIGMCHPLVLPQMLDPGLDQKVFKVAPRCRCVFEQTPGKSAIALAFMA